MIAPALVTLADTMVWTGQFDEAERWLQRAARALQTDAGPDKGLMLHKTTGMLEAARGRNREALEEFSAAEYLQAQLEELARHGKPGDRLDGGHTSPPRDDRRGQRRSRGAE